MPEELINTEATLQKVHDVLRRAGLGYGETIGIINDMQNAGIYFREAGQRTLVRLSQDKYELTVKPGHTVLVLDHDQHTMDPPYLHVIGKLRTTWDRVPRIGEIELPVVSVDTVMHVPVQQSEQELIKQHGIEKAAEVLEKLPPGLYIAVTLYLKPHQVTLYESRDADAPQIG